MFMNNNLSPLARGVTAAVVHGTRKRQKLSVISSTNYVAPSNPLVLDNFLNETDIDAKKTEDSPGTKTTTAKTTSPTRSATIQPKIATSRRLKSRRLLLKKASVLKTDIKRSSLTSSSLSSAAPSDLLLQQLESSINNSSTQPFLSNAAEDTEISSIPLISSHDNEIDEDKIDPTILKSRRSLRVIQGGVGSGSVQKIQKSNIVDNNNTNANANSKPNANSTANKQNTILVNSGNTNQTKQKVSETNSHQGNRNIKQQKNKIVQKKLQVTTRSTKRIAAISTKKNLKADNGCNRKQHSSNNSSNLLINKSSMMTPSPNKTLNQNATVVNTNSNGSNNSKNQIQSLLQIQQQKSPKKDSTISSGNTLSSPSQINIIVNYSTSSLQSQLGSTTTTTTTNTQSTDGVVTLPVASGFAGVVVGANKTQQSHNNSIGSNCNVRNSMTPTTNGNGSFTSGAASSATRDYNPINSNACSNNVNSGGINSSNANGGNIAGGGSGCASSSSKQNYPHSSSTFSLNKNEEFHFVKPPDCPVFKPNEEEFRNPLAYIGKIRPFAEKYGIAKIQPPKSWTPPFTVDVDKLKFTPRVQRLNELEAKTRVKLNFLDQIAKFWELQGSSLKIPMVERKALDLYSLHRIVQEEGGIDQTTRERKWSRVAHRMGYPSGKSIGAILKGHYERILHPFDIFTSGKAIDIKLETEIDDQDYKPHGIVSRQQITPPNETTARRSKRFANATQATCGLGSNSTNINNNGNLNSNSRSNNFNILSTSSVSVSGIIGDTNPYHPNQHHNSNKIYCNISTHNNSSAGNSSVNNQSPNALIKEEIKDEYNSIGYGEYKRMHSYGFGGKMATGGCGRSRKSMHNNNCEASSGSNAKRKQKKNDPLAKYICHFCNRGDAEENMLLCDGCDDSYHTFCLMPPLNDIPKGDWRCPKCVVEEVSKPQEAFGFEQAQREYTLQQFGEMADQFKADYFNMAVHLVPTELVEREFWRIVSSIDEDVTVEYGADLHTMDHGSGFPTKSSLYLLPGDQEYAESSWNLNNLPILEESILGHINADISGMKVPWMYVGMCFATFCWHNEDHWSYSINYLHWGEPKTWYGVPGSKAEAFEETMKSAAPELFHSQPDLLHQLVTIMNPNILMKNNVPVYRTDQHAGEFVITFPRAYHAGFNQGYNFAEAVNFAPADWMKMGRECINHYSMLRRFCVFSHDELVCKMALNPDKLNLGIATACYLDMAEMVDSEKKLRKSLLEWGVTKAEREAFELIPDDERQCDACKTTCFLSAVTCSCTKSIVCLRHYTELCSCMPEKHTLKYRYTLDELPLMLKKLKVKAETFENWLSKVRDVLDPNTATTITLEELQNLALEAEEKKFPSSVILERLNSAVLEAEKCVTVIQQLDINKMRTRTRNSAESAKYKLTMDELDLFVQEIDNLCCIIQEGQSVRDLQLLGKDFVEASKHILSKKLNKLNDLDIEQIIEEGSVLCIDLPEMERLKSRQEQLRWYKKIREYRDLKEKMSLNDIHNFIKEGLSIVPDVLIEKELVHLQKVLLAIEYWEEVAKKCFESGTQHVLPEIEVLLERACDIEGELPSEPALRDAVRKAKEWLHNVEVLQSNENYPYFHTLENVVNRGKMIPFHLEELKRMEDHLDAARIWKDKTAKTFLKKQTQFHLMDVLSPRCEAIMIGSRFKKKLPEEQFSEDMTPQQMVNQFKEAEEKEMLDMCELRKLNMSKNPGGDKYCICKRKFSGNMFNCQLCKDWFHEQCVPPPRNTVRPRPQNSTPLQTSTTSIVSDAGIGGNNNCNNNHSVAAFIPQINYREKDCELKYLCPSCMRSRRPRLETILQLLVSLQRLPIRLPEGEALQCLTERAMNWQDRARQAFASDSVVAALTTLSLLSHKNYDNSIVVATKESTTIRNDNLVPRKSIQRNGAGGVKKKCTPAGKKNLLNSNNSCMSAAIVSNAKGNRKQNQQMARKYCLSKVAKCSDASAEFEDDIEFFESSSDDDIDQFKYNSRDNESIMTAIVSQSKCIDSSSFSINNNNLSSPTTTLTADSCSNSPLLRTADMPLILLDKITQDKLEDLMIEGDLLEVSLDETLNIWKILNAAKPSISDLAQIQSKYNLTNYSNDNLVNNNGNSTNQSSSVGNKKRRSADDSATNSTIPNKRSSNVKHNLAAQKRNQSATQSDVIENGSKLKRGRKIKKMIKGSSFANSQSGICRSSLEAKENLKTSRCSSESKVLLETTAASSQAWIEKATFVKSEPQMASVISAGMCIITTDYGAAVSDENIKMIAQVTNDSIKIDENNASGNVKNITEIVTQHTPPTTSTSINATINFNSGKKRKRATTSNVMSKKAAAAAAAAAAQVQLQQIAAIVSTTASTSDDDEECSAPNCAKPSGREVDWVQCDGGCNKWFHMFCVGLDKNEIKPDDDYICKRCKKTTNKYVGNTNDGATIAEVTISTAATNSMKISNNAGATTSKSATVTTNSTAIKTSTFSVVTSSEMNIVAPSAETFVLNDVNNATFNQNNNNSNTTKNVNSNISNSNNKGSNSFKTSNNKNQINYNNFDADAVTNEKQINKFKKNKDFSESNDVSEHVEVYDGIGNDDDVDETNVFNLIIDNQINDNENKINNTSYKKNKMDDDDHDDNDESSEKTLREHSKKNINVATSSSCSNSSIIQIITESDSASTPTTTHILKNNRQTTLNSNSNNNKSMTIVSTASFLLSTTSATSISVPTANNNSSSLNVANNSNNKNNDNYTSNSNATNTSNH